MSFALLTVVLMVVGFALLAAELFVIPGFGVVGILGAASLLGAAVVAWTQLGPTFGILALGAGIAVSGLLVWLFPRTAAGKALHLGDAVVGRHHGSRDRKVLLGKTGRALTPLRPSGTVDIDDASVDVVTDGEYVASGTRVRVVRVEGSRVVVEPIPDDAQA